MNIGDYIGVTQILMTILSGFVVFVYNTLTKADKDNREEIIHRIENLEKTIERQLKDFKEEVGDRVDKLEENSRRDDETVKELVKDSEARTTTEIGARIRNIVELQQKTEGINANLLNKFEQLLDRLAKLEGKSEK